jgi:hypothetical protein
VKLAELIEGFRVRESGEGSAARSLLAGSEDGGSYEERTHQD